MVHGGAAGSASRPAPASTMSRSANLTEWLVWALARGHRQPRPRRAAATFNPGFLRAIEDALPGGRGDLGPRPASRPDLPRIVNGELPCAALADEIEAGAVRALIVRMGNPALAIPDPERIAGALGSLDLLVAIEAHPSQTTDVATHVLPVADHFERADLRDRLPAGDAVPALRARRRRAARRTAPAVVGVRRAEPADGPAAVRQRRAATPSCARRELDDEVIAGVDGRPRPAPVGRGAERRPTACATSRWRPGWLVPGAPAPAPRPRPARAGRPVQRAVARARRPRRRRWCSSTGARPASTTRCAVRPAPEPEVLVHPDDAAAPWPARRRPGRGSPPRRARATCRCSVTDTIGRGRRVVPPRLPVGERQPAHVDGRRRSAQRHADPVRLRRRALRAPHSTLTVASSASSTMPTTAPG